MRKILLLLAAFAFISLPVIMNSCEEDNSESCRLWEPQVNGMHATYPYNQSLEFCLSYKDALETYLGFDCDNSYDDEYKTIMENLPC